MPPDSDATSLAFNDAIAKFEAGWREGTPPDLSELLLLFPDAPRERLIIELAHIDLEFRLKQGQLVRAEEYLIRLPELGRDVKVVESLLQTELVFRRRAILKLLTVDTASADHPTTLRLNSLPDFPGYEVIGILGRGAMGVVYKARQQAANRIVAVKTLPADKNIEIQDLRRFVGEAEAAGMVTHPSIIQIYEVQTDSSIPFFSMEYLAGETLAERIAKQLPTPRQAAALLAVLADAVHAAHTAGVIHRDLKPSNILFTTSPSPNVLNPWDGETTAKISDFGLARYGDSAGLTHTGDLLGTPYYMAPEQARGDNRAVDQRADIWALGVILYECLTGHRPFTAGSISGILDSLLNMDPVSPRIHRSDVPRDLNSICMKCLHKDPSRRYAVAADLAEDLKRFLAYLPTVARPVGLWERLVKWRRRNPVWSGVLVAILLTIVYVAWWLDANVRTHTKYYSEIITRYGVKEGYRELTSAERSARAWVYRVSRRAGRVIEVVTLAAQDQPSEFASNDGVIPRNSERTGFETSGVYRFRYEYDATGRLVEEVALGRLGNELYRLHFTTKTTAHYTNPSGLPKAASTLNENIDVPVSLSIGEHSYVPSTGLPRARTHSGVVYLRFEWTPEGYTAAEFYSDADGRPRPNDGGIYGKRWDVRPDGLRRGVTFIGRDGRPAVSSIERYATVRYESNEFGKTTRLEYFDANGRPCQDRNGVAKSEMTYDDVGNLIFYHMLDSGGNPTEYVPDGHASSRREYDSSGHLVRWEFLGRDGRPCWLNRGYAIIAYRYDKRGRRFAEDYLAPDGKPGRLTTYISGIRRRFDQQDNVVEYEYLGPDGRLCRDDKWVARVIQTVDHWGRITARRYFGPDGHPCWDSEGVGGFVQEYGAAGQVARFICVDPKGHKVACRSGYAVRAMHYDSRGNPVRTNYFDTDNTGCLNDNFYHKIDRKFNDDGLEIETSFYDVNGQPARDNSGVSVYQRMYDADGNLAVIRYYGPDGLPCANTNGVFSKRMKYDRYGRMLETRYFGVDDKPCRDRFGEAGIRKEYDEKGRTRQETCLGPDGQPALDRFKVAIRRHTRDRLGNLVRAEFLDPAGHLAEDEDGCAEIRKEFDDYNNVKETAYFDKRGRPCTDNGGTHAIRNRYDARDNPITIEYLGTDRKPKADDYGNARIDTRYDDRDHELSETGFDAEGKPCLDRYGNFEIRYTYDEIGNESGAQYFDPLGKPVQSVFGYFGYISQYSIKWLETNRTYLDFYGNPLPTRVVAEEVKKSGVGYAAGLRDGDVLESYDGQPVKFAFLLERLWKMPRAFSTAVPLVVNRQGVKLTLTVMTGDLEVDLADAVPGLFPKS